MGSSHHNKAIEPESSPDEWQQWEAELCFREQMDAEMAKQRAKPLEKLRQDLTGVV